MDFASIITLLGGLSVFLFGMKLMSESLQSVAGDRLKTILGKMTTNRFTGVFSGLWITAFIQSSSATTVMVVGFVNAGLLSLNQAIGLIMGANIGTTITAWLVALLGFKVKVSSFALPAIIIGLLLTFKKNESSRGWGNTLIGFGILFLGLDFMKNSIPDAAKHAETFAFLSQFTEVNYLSILFFIFIGTLLTIVIQSSSATTTITITLAFTGHIPIHAALAMILGENIGTTITAFLASLAGNHDSKKAALAHTLFNIMGVIWAILFFFPFMQFIDFIVPEDPLINKESTRFHISAFHTAFNIINTGILIWFVSHIERLVNFLAKYIIPADKVKVKYTIPALRKVIGFGTIHTPEAAIITLEAQNKKLIRIALKGLKRMEYLIIDKYQNESVEALLEEEKELDTARTETLHYLAQVQEIGITGHIGLKVFEIMERIKIIEEISDNMAKVAKKIRNAHNYKIALSKKKQNIIIEQINYIKQQKKLLKDNMNELTNPSIKKLSQKLYDESHAIFRELDKKTLNRKKIESNKHELSAFFYFMDMARLLDLISKHLHKIIILDDLE
ncbi:MAG: Na/Pi cotransporter family protein [Spirochaetia bacterium]|nr:Na/Pi cotransporter family protein [Spirochaetia bacterium]